MPVPFPLGYVKIRILFRINGGRRGGGIGGCLRGGLGCCKGCGRALSCICVLGTADDTLIGGLVRLYPGFLCCRIRSRASALASRSLMYAPTSAFGTNFTIMVFVGDGPAPAGEPYFVWICGSKYPLSEFIHEFIDNIAEEGKTFESYPGWGLRQYYAVRDTVADQPDQWWSCLTTGFSYMVMIFKDHAGRSLADIDGILHHAIWSAVFSNCEIRNITPTTVPAPGDNPGWRSYPTNNLYFYTQSDVKHSLTLGVRSWNMMPNETNSIPYRAKIYTSMYNTLGNWIDGSFRIIDTMPFSSVKFDTWGIATSNVAYRHCFLTGYNLSEYGVGIGAVIPRLQYGTAPSEYGYRYFVIQSCFPMVTFMRDFCTNVSSSLCLPSSVISWFKFLSMCSHMPSMGTDGLLKYNMLSSNRQGCHFVYAYISYAQDWGSMLSRFYGTWQHRSEYDPSTRGFLVFASASETNFDITGATNSKSGDFNVPEVALPSNITDDIWECVPGQEGRRTPLSAYGWNMSPSYATWERLGGTFYVQESAPTEPSPTDPLIGGVSNISWTGTNAPFWNAVLSSSKQTSQIFAQFPSETESNLQAVIQLRQFVAQEAAQSKLATILRTAANDSSWTLAAILSSDMVIPYNVHLIPQIIAWYQAVKPSEVIGISDSSVSDVTQLLHSLIRGEITLGDVIIKAPANALKYATELLYLTKYYRTGTYP